MDYFKTFSSKISTGSGNLYSKSSLLTKIDNLNNLIINQNGQIDSLQAGIKKRESIVSRMYNEKQKLCNELKKQQHENNSLKNKFNDERNMFNKNKNALYKEIESLKINKADEISEKENDTLLELERENACLKIGMKTSAETIYSLCTKFLKLKASKTALKSELEASVKKTSGLMVEMNTLLEDNKRELKKLVKKELKHGDQKSLNKKYLLLINKNSHLQYENTVLRMKLSMVNSCLDKTDGGKVGSD